MESTVFIAVLSLLAFGASADAQSNDPYAGKWYQLTTQFTGPGQCLEGNQKGGSEKNGNAYMDQCQNVSGQIWKLERQPDGNYRLKTKFRGDGECLEGNTGGRGAFMDKCQNVPGQLWKITPADNGYVRLQNLMGDNCLEGNRSDLPGAGGAAYMDTKQDVSGQLWKLTKPALASLPDEFLERFRQSEFNSLYVIAYDAVNPFLTGDFDGDGKMDYALKLRAKTNEDVEEDVVFFAKGESRLLSNDIKEEYPGPAWHVVLKKERPDLKGDAIMMVRPESSTALVSWDGKRFQLSWEGG